ncbi:MAG: dienelactone hydrolase family protein, partial [Planctomycetota bacterium]
VVLDLLARLPVDRERIYLAGLSSGGNGCWEFAKRHPELFAAVAPMAAGYSSTEGLCRLVSIPIWVFHGSDDASVSAEGARRMTQRLRELGGNVCLTEISTTSHDCWTAAFGEYRRLDWLLTQRRGVQNLGHPPGVVPLSSRLENALAGWAWWQLFLQSIVLFVFAVVLVQSMRKIQKARVKRMASRIPS